MDLEEIFMGRGRKTWIKFWMLVCEWMILKNGEYWRDFKRGVYLIFFFSLLHSYHLSFSASKRTNFYKSIKCICTPLPSIQCKQRTDLNWTIDDWICHARIQNCASGFTAELRAEFSCLQTIINPADPPHQRTQVFLSGSLFYLQAIFDIQNERPLAQRIHLLLHTLHTK